MRRPESQNAVPTFLQAGIPYESLMLVTVQGTVVRQKQEGFLGSRRPARQTVPVPKNGEVPEKTAKDESHEMLQSLVCGIIVYDSTRLCYASRPYGNAIVPESQDAASIEKAAKTYEAAFIEGLDASMLHNI